MKWLRALIFPVVFSLFFFALEGRDCGISVIICYCFTIINYCIAAWAAIQDSEHNRYINAQFPAVLASTICIIVCLVFLIFVATRLYFNIMLNIAINVAITVINILIVSLSNDADQHTYNNIAFQNSSKETLNACLRDIDRLMAGRSKDEQGALAHLYDVVKNAPLYSNSYTFDGIDARIKSLENSDHLISDCNEIIKIVEGGNK